MGESTPTGTGDAATDTATRPCVYCGRPVAQRGSAGRPFRYCRDNDNACQRHARNGRMRERNSPGLPGQVARSWELVERLELAAATLADALHAELSPAGVERQTATVRAEAAAQIAGAHTERDEARREAESTRAELATLRDRLTVIDAALVDAAAELAAVRIELSAAHTTTTVAVRERDDARISAAGEAALRVDAYAQRDQATVLAGERQAQVLAAVRTRDDALVAAHTATEARDVAEVSANAARSDLTAALGERDEARARVGRLADEVEAARTATASAATTHAERVRALEAAAESLRDGRLKAVWDRDAARQEAASAAANAAAATEALRAEYAALAARVAALGGQLSSARAELAAERGVSARLDAQVTTLTAALTGPPPEQVR